jgi:hypothetical protein
LASSSNIRAGAAYIELYTKDNRLTKGLNAASAKLKAFGAGITSVGTKLAGIGAGAWRTRRGTPDIVAPQRIRSMRV